MKILVTGSAGFIGYHTCMKLARRGHQIIGIDNLNDYYDINLKKKRLSELKKLNNFKFYKIDIAAKNKIDALFESNVFDKIIHLAAQPGVQHSVTNPEKYMNSNLLGFFNILCCSIENKISHLIYASSSSVYGTNRSYPFKENLNCSSPLSFYAATKISNEVMAHSFSNIYNIKTTGLRFFTVYGTYGRPDMSPFIFADSIMNNKYIKIYNEGNLKRDFTHIDDAVKAIVLITESKNNLKKLSNIYNIGSNSPISILKFINFFEKFIGKPAKLIFKPLLKGDVNKTFADISAINRDYKFKPEIPIVKGVEEFINWYKKYKNNEL